MQPFPHGLFRVGDASSNRSAVCVRFRSADIDVSEQIYRDQNLTPDFASLPYESERPGNGSVGTAAVPQETGPPRQLKGVSGLRFWTGRMLGL